MRILSFLGFLALSSSLENSPNMDSNKRDGELVHNLASFPSPGTSMQERNVCVQDIGFNMVSSAWDLTFPKRNKETFDCPTQPGNHTSSSFFNCRRKEDLDMLVNSPWKQLLYDFGDAFYGEASARFSMSEEEMSLARPIAQAMKENYIAASGCSSALLFNRQESKSVCLAGGDTPAPPHVEPYSGGGMYLFSSEKHEHLETEGNKFYSPISMLDLHELWHVEECPLNVPKTETSFFSKGAVESLTTLREQILSDEILKLIRNIPIEEILDYQKSIRILGKDFPKGEIVNTYRRLLKVHKTLARAYTSPESISYLTGLSPHFIKNLEQRNVVFKCSIDIKSLLKLTNEYTKDGVLFLMSKGLSLEYLTRINYEDQEAVTMIHFMLSHRELLEELIGLNTSLKTALDEKNRLQSIAYLTGFSFEFIQKLRDSDLRYYVMDLLIEMKGKCTEEGLLFLMDKGISVRDLCFRSTGRDVISYALAHREIFEQLSSLNIPLTQIYQIDSEKVPMIILKKMDAFKFLLNSGTIHFDLFEWLSAGKVESVLSYPDSFSSLLAQGFIEESDFVNMSAESLSAIGANPENFIAFLQRNKLRNLEEFRREGNCPLYEEYPEKEFVKIAFLLTHAEATKYLQEMQHLNLRDLLILSIDDFEKRSIAITS